MHADVGSVNVRVECERRVLIFVSTVVHCSDIFFFDIIFSSSCQVHTQVPVLPARVLRVACWERVLAAQRREGRVGLHRDRHLLEVSPYNYIVISFTNFQKHHYCNSLLVLHEKSHGH